MFDLSQNPVIAVARDTESFSDCLKAPSEGIFLLAANVLDVAEQVKMAKAVKKTVFVHVDMAQGIGKDRAGLEFLKKCGVEGIISTKNNIISLAKELGLVTIQRFFMIDSQSFFAALENVKASAPDMVEVLPGVIPKIIERFAQKVGRPVIAGGLIETKEDIIEALSHGATAVSTAREKLWFV